MATYIMTATVFVMIALGAFTASPWLALAVALTFALVRGLAVLATARFTTFDSLAAFHRRFHALGPVVQRTVVFTQLGAALVAAGAVWGWIGVLALVVVATAGISISRLPRRGADRAGRARTHREPVATAPR